MVLAALPFFTLLVCSRSAMFAEDDFFMDIDMRVNWMETGTLNTHVEMIFYGSLLFQRWWHNGNTDENTEPLLHR
jgi:hypothetical protein